MAATLTPLEGGGDDYDGEQLANELFDLIHRQLPRLHPADPYRRVLAQWLPVLGDSLGRPLVRSVGGGTS